MKETDIPKEIGEVLGYTTGERLDRFIHDIVTASTDKDDILMSPEVEQAMRDLRIFMFESVYTNPKAKSEEVKAQNLLEGLFAYYMEHPEILPEEYLGMLEAGTDTKEIVVCDYISGMTDQYAIYKFEEFYVPKSWNA